MNRVLSLLILATVLVSACIIYLVVNGISLRAEPLITPSIMETHLSNVPTALVTRMFQEFQNSEFIIWGLQVNSPEAQQLISSAAENYKKIFHQAVQFIHSAENATETDLLNCKKPCWLLVPETQAHHLEKNSFIENKVLKLNRSYISITLISFQPDELVTPDCNQQKRLTLKCFIPVSIRSVRRKMPNPQQRYFFLNKYYDNDYFLFAQSAFLDFKK